MNTTTPPDHSRRAPLRFVAIFAVCVPLLLLAWQFAIPTAAHDAYLYGVAWNTRTVLSVLGDSAVLESLDGNESPWRQWRARAKAARSEAPPRGAIGPLVKFTLNAPEEQEPIRRFTFIVVPSCGAGEILVLYLAAVLAFPATWRARLWGLGLGLPALYLVNIARLVVLALIGALDTSGKWFAFVHEYVWQAAYLVIVAVAWLLWANGAARRTS